MTEEFIIGFARQAMEVMFMICLPVLMVSLAVGVVISIFQSVTQIQEMTITFVPKILVTFLSLLFLGPWMIGKLLDFTREIIQNIPHWVH
jgi:flagellar biosynthetic protein FliQ